MRWGHGPRWTRSRSLLTCTQCSARLACYDMYPKCIHNHTLSFTHWHYIAIALTATQRRFPPLSSVHTLRKNKETMVNQVMVSPGLCRGIFGDSNLKSMGGLSLLFSSSMLICSWLSFCRRSKEEDILNFFTHAHNRIWHFSLVVVDSNYVSDNVISKNFLFGVDDIYHNCS